MINKLREAFLPVMPTLQGRIAQAVISPQEIDHTDILEGFAKVITRIS
jgi:hypothetical protein